MHRNPRKITWTVLYRRKHKKGTTEEVAKKRTRRNIKFQRSVQGATLENILAKRNQKPEVRKAQREQAIRLVCSLNLYLPLIPETMSRQSHFRTFHGFGMHVLKMTWCVLYTCTFTYFTPKKLQDLFPLLIFFIRKFLLCQYELASRFLFFSTCKSDVCKSPFGLANYFPVSCCSY